MMGFITGITNEKCDICKKEFIGTGGTAYDDYFCEQCDWEGKVCKNCASSSKRCPKCGEKIKSRYDEMCKKAGGSIMF